MVTAAVDAERVSKQDALQKAQQFMPQKQFENSRVFARSGGVSEVEPFYIFNVENNGGYVIVSGDDRTKEILGYASTGHIDMNNLPDNLCWWLDYYANVISSLKKNSSFRQSNPNSVMQEISPLIQTQWHQYSPFNNQCIINGETCVTGCVAIAMAQVMNYWKWPESTKGISSYTINSQTIETLPGTSFNWTNMSDGDLAKLCRYCGQSVKMLYSPYGSGASDGLIPSALVNDFNYDQGVHSVFRESFRPDDWENLIYNEIHAGRPVIYSGQSTTGYGHSFICDGYKDGLFHVNWGWGGLCDSYFVLTVMDSFGSENIDDTYSEDQSAIIGIQKPNGGSADYPLVSIINLENESPDVVTRTSSGGNFQTKLSWKVCSSVINETPVNLMFALYKGEDKVYEMIPCQVTLVPGIFYLASSDISFGAGLSDGIYRIEIYYTDGSGTHYPQGFGYRYVEAVIKGNTMTLTNYPNAPEDHAVGNEFSCETVEGVFTCKVTSLSPKTVEISTASVSSNSSVVRVPGVIDGYKVTGIGQGAFCHQEGITELYIPASIEYITNADDHPSLTFFDMPNLEKIVVDEANPYFESWNNCNAIIERANGMLHRGCKNTVIPDDVRIIGPAAFSHDKGFTVGQLPDGITKIAPWAFYGTNATTDIILPQSLEALGDYAFSQFTSLRAIVSPSSNPPVFEKSAFMAQHENLDNWEIEYERAVLYVPEGALESYHSTPCWNWFKKISTISDKGDVNGDYTVDSKDISDLAEYLISKSDNLPCQGGDLDIDGWVDVHDLYNLTEMQNGNAIKPYVNGLNALEEQVITLDNSTTITPKKQGKVNVFLNNADFNATAVNWAAIIPDGIELVKQSDGHYITMSDRMGDNFVLFDYLDGNVLHVLAYRENNHVIEPITSPSPIMSFDVKLLKDASPAVDENGTMLQKIEFVSDSESDADLGFDKLVTGRERRGNLTIDDQGKAWATWGASCLIEIGEDNPADDIPRVTIEQGENGSVAYDLEGTTVTLTVTPADDYFITPDDIKVEKTVDGGFIVQAPEIADMLTVTPVDVDDRGRGTYTFTIEDGDCVQVSSIFTPCIPIKPEISITGWTYGAVANEPVVAGNTGNGTETITYASKGSDAFSVTVPEDAGDYIVKVSIAAVGHYLAGNATANFTIAKASGSISYAISNISKTYGEAGFTNELTIVGDGMVIYTSDNTSVATVDAATGEVTIISSGTAKITVTVTDGKNYTYAAKTATYTLNVSDKTNLTTAIGDADAFYSSIIEKYPNIASKLKDAIDAAKAVLDNPESTQEEIDAALGSLDVAVKLMEEAVEESRRGDANDDCVVDEADIEEVVNYIMGKASDIFNADNADVNKDGVINAADIVEIVKIIKVGQKL